MFGSQPVIPLVLAQAAEAPGSTLIQFLPLVGAVALFLFMSARSQSQQEKKRREMINSLKKNDKVLTSAGMYGTVVAVDAENDRVTLRISEEGNVRVVFSRSGIVRPVTEATDKK